MNGSSYRAAPDGSPTSYASVPLVDEDNDQQFDTDNYDTSPTKTNCTSGTTTPGGIIAELRSNATFHSHTSQVDANCLDRLSTALEGSCLGALFDRFRAGEFTVSPEDNSLLDFWDMVVICALFGTAVMLPFEVALISTPGPKLMLFDNIINGIFICDMVLNFNVGYAANDNTAHVVYVRNPFMIAGNYMAMPFSKNLTAGWFWPDLITVIPWDSLSTRMKDVKNLRSMRLVRVLRLVRMLRLVRVIKLFKRWHTVVGFSFALVKCARCTCLTLLLVHWLACVWAHLGQHPEEYLKGSTIEDTWISEIAQIEGEETVEDLGLFKIYTRSLYWCTVVLTTVGFGDVIPHNSAEHIMMVITIFITGFTWAWVVGNVVDVINNSDIFQTSFNQTMDDLNVLMGTRCVKKHLRFRIRKHLYESQLVHRQRHQLQTVTWLSETLQGELALESGLHDILECVWFLRSVPTSVVIELAMHFKPDLFSPSEFVMDHQSLFVIRKGAALRRGKMLTRGSIFGEDMILVTDALRDSVCPRTLTFLEVMQLGIDGLRGVCTKFADFDARLRKAQIKLAVQRAFVHDAARIKRRRERAERKRREKAGLQALTPLKGEQTDMWDKNFFGRGQSDEIHQQKKLLKQAKMGWADSINKVGQSAERDRAALSSLNKELTQLQKSLTDMTKSSNNDDSLDDLERLLLQSQEKSKKRLDSLEVRFDATQKWLEVICDATGRSRSQLGLGYTSGSSAASSSNRPASSPAAKYQSS